ncbi:hypothetical protein [Streptomyces sp. NPDC005012]|uniref:hypothetical protein n=1 Tax=Streptomyces sp. NPDC005012 TaxID=3154558 RepID=UPI0033B4186A
MIHPVAELYLTATTLGWAVIAFLLATTAGVRGRWTRFTAAAAALLPVALLDAALIERALQDAAYSQPYEERRGMIYAAVIAGVVALTLAAAIALVCRAYRIYRWFVVGFLVGLGALHLSAIGVLAATLEPGVRMTAYAWLPGAGYLLAAVFAALAARGTAALASTPDPLSTLPPATASQDSPPRQTEPGGQLRTMAVCGSLGVLMAGVGVLVGYAVEADQTFRIPDSPGFPTLPGLPTDGPVPDAPPGAPELPRLEQAAAGGPSPLGGAR